MFARFVPRFVSESRAYRVVTHPWSRQVLRVTRTCALGVGIYGAGYAFGVQSTLDDPEGMSTSILRNVLKTHAGGGVLPTDAPESLLVSRLGQELLVAARKRESPLLRAHSSEPTPHSPLLTANSLQQPARAHSSHAGAAAVAYAGRSRNVHTRSSH